MQMPVPWYAHYVETVLYVEMNNTVCTFLMFVTLTDQVVYQLIHKQKKKHPVTGLLSTQLALRPIFGLHSTCFDNFHIGKVILANTVIQGLSWKVDNYSSVRKLTIFMESKGSLSCSQKPTTGPYPDFVQCSPSLHTLFLEDHFNIILKSFLEVFRQKLECISHLPHACYMILISFI
jgi:hypothetical protein